MRAGADGELGVVNVRRHRPSFTAGNDVMYGEGARSVGSKTVLALCHASGVAIAIWLLAFGGLDALGVTRGAPVRRGLIVGCAGVYLVRWVFASVARYRRKVSWVEGVSVGLWLATVHVILAVLGGSTTTGFSNLDVAALELYALGSFISAKSEIDRARWKRVKTNAGHLYTLGWFRFSRHINYLGEVIALLGYALLTRQTLAFAVPAATFAFTISVSIPRLDRYLGQRYGVEFDAYARRTKRLVPWIY